MTRIDIKRAYDKTAPADGYRILVDRLWPRGIKKERLRMDYWAKEIAPSNELRKWYHEDMATRHAGFMRRYTKELAENPAAEDFVRLVGSQPQVTLLYAAKDPLGNEAAIVRGYLEKRLNGSASR